MGIVVVKHLALDVDLVPISIRMKVYRLDERSQSPTWNIIGPLIFVRPLPIDLYGIDNPTWRQNVRQHNARGTSCIKLTGGRKCYRQTLKY